MQNESTSVLGINISASGILTIPLLNDDNSARVETEIVTINKNGILVSINLEEPQATEGDRSGVKFRKEYDFVAKQTGKHLTYGKHFG